MSSSAVVIHGLRSILLGSLVVFACSTTRVAHDLPPTPRETPKQPTEQAVQKSTSITGEAETSEISATSSVESSAGGRTAAPMASVHTLPSWRPPNLDLDGDHQADIAWLNFVWSPFTAANARRLVRLPECRACHGWSDWTPIGDVDHDGFGDAWVNMPEKQLWFGGPDGLVATDFPASIPSVATDVEPIPLGDFDGDSYDDILIPKVGIGFGNGRASMDVVTVPELPRILPAGDVDGDGIADILALYPVPEVIFGGARQIAALSRLSIGVESPVETASWSVARDHGKAMIVFWNCAARGNRHTLTLQRWTVLDRVLTPLPTIVDPRGIECETAYSTSFGDMDGDEITDFVTDVRDSSPRNLSFMRTILSTSLTSKALKSRLLVLPSPVVFVRPVGDVNGDGLDDLLGMQLENTGSINALFLYVGVKGRAPRRARTLTADIWLRQ